MHSPPASAKAAIAGDRVISAGMAGDALPKLRSFVLIDIAK